VPANLPQSTTQIWKRRSFLALFPGTLAGVAFLPLLDSLPIALAQTPDSKDKKTGNLVCWLDVCAPFIVEDPEMGLHSEIVLTSDTFVGAQGYADGADAILKGAQMAIAEINAKGGAAGYKLEALVFDSATPAAGQYDPAQAATNYKKFIADSLVLAAVGPNMSGEGKAISPILSEADMATITPSSTNPDIGASRVRRISGKISSVSASNSSTVAFSVCVSIIICKAIWLGRPII
jgi:hypothetical protein